MARASKPQKERVLEADRLVIGAPEGERVEVEAGALKLYGPDGKLRVRVDAEDDGSHIGLFTPESESELDPVVSVSAHDQVASLRFFKPPVDNVTVEIVADGNDLPTIRLFDENLEVIFEEPLGRLTHEDRISKVMAEAVADYILEHDVDNGTLGNALEAVPAKIRRALAAVEKGGAR